MFKTYVTITLRNLSRQKKYAFINLAALTLGLVPVILILLYVQYELSFDRYHKKKDQIYRVVNETTGLFGQKFLSPMYPSPLAQTMVDKLPEVVSVTRLQDGGSRELEYGEKKFVERNLIYADREIFDIFSFEIVKGNPKTALAQPQSIVLSEAMAKKYFDDEEPMGKFLKLDGFRELRVTGVLKNVPKQSHFLVDFLVPASLMGRSNTRAGVLDPNSWGFANFFIYFLVRQDADVGQLEKKFPKFLETYSSNQHLNRARHFFQPLSDIHLYSHLSTELRPNGDINMVYLYASIAVIILLVGCISYINLATIRSTERAKEVGMRKVCGANRSQLIMQFLGESTVLTLLATIMAIYISALVLPYFNSFVESEIEMGILIKGQSLLWLFTVIALVCICSGSYPALVLSAFEPVMVLKGKFGNAKPSHFKTALVIAQCAFSMLFIIMVLVVHKQLAFFRNNDLGLKKDPIVVIRLDGKITANLEAVKTELRRYPNILHVSSVSYLANQSYTQRRLKIPGQPDDATIDMCYSNVDYDYLDLFEIEVMAGRKFSKDFPTAVRSSFILNETATKALGWKESAIGREFSDGPNRKGTIIGIIKDFHLESLHEPIKPLYLFIDPDDSYYNLCVRISPNKIPETIAFIKATIGRIAPNFAFNYRFYDEIFDQQYRVEQKLGRLFSIFAALAVTIACLGLFGLVSLTTAQRTKEIGIRKVLGASPARITTLLTRDYAKWVFLASLIAWPLAWYGANKWLQSFAYRTNLNWELFVLSSALLLGIVLLTVGYQAFRAANANPVVALRYE